MTTFTTAELNLISVVTDTRITTNGLRRADWHVRDGDDAANVAPEYLGAWEANGYMSETGRYTMTAAGSAVIRRAISAGALAPTADAELDED